MTDGYDATSTIRITAPPQKVWAVLTDAAAAKEYMFGTELDTAWEIGGDIRWHGEWNGTAYEDHGVIVEVEPHRRLVYTHFSPLSGDEDVPENHHTLTWTLDDSGDGSTILALTQDNNATPAAAEHSKTMWDSLVAKVKEIAERS